MLFFLLIEKIFIMKLLINKFCLQINDLLFFWCNNFGKNWLSVLRRLLKRNVNHFGDVTLCLLQSRSADCGGCWGCFGSWCTFVRFIFCHFRWQRICLIVLLIWYIFDWSLGLWPWLFISVCAYIRNWVKFKWNFIIVWLLSRDFTEVNKIWLCFWVNRHCFIWFLILFFICSECINFRLNVVSTYLFSSESRRQ